MFVRPRHMHMSYMYVQPAIGFETLNAIARARINDGVKKVYIYIYIYEWDEI